MRRTRRTSVLGLLTATATAAALLTPLGTASADPGDDSPPPAAPAPGGDIRPHTGDYNDGKAIPLDKKSLRDPAPRSSKARSNSRMANGNHEVGDVLSWPALDDIEGPYLKDFTLRGLGDNIQIWVADDRAFPGSDCRNPLGMTDVTDAQVQNFITEYDNNILPKESAAFSVAPDKNGANAALEPNLGEGYYTVADSQSDDVVVLVDNVRDSNYYEPTTPDGQTYIAGFFWTYFNALADRNIMTIDAFDWAHRTGANPPDDSDDPDFVACAEAQGVSGGRGYGVARPRLYEGTFAHEYQHLLESYEDPDESPWVNEGLSDYAQSLVGYVDTTVPPDADGADGHISCFAGYLGENFGGPENSLTAWEDQGGPEILCDYGAAYTFMEYLDSLYGDKILTALHRQDRNGLDGLDAALDSIGAKSSASKLLHTWSAAMAIDRVLEKGRKLTGATRTFMSPKDLSMKINWDTPQAYESPGAPMNGSDYVRLRKGSKYY